jgi:hypothetical protein
MMSSLSRVRESDYSKFGRGRSGQLLGPMVVDAAHGLKTTQVGKVL